MGGGEGNKGGYNKGDDAENMCSSSLEPDSRYDSCCSSIFRPGRVLRDLIVGFLVVLGIAVVIAVLFVVCVFFVPSDDVKESAQLKGEAHIGLEREVEHNVNDLDFIGHGDHTGGHEHGVDSTGDLTKYEHGPEHGLEFSLDHGPEYGLEHGPEYGLEHGPHPEPETEAEPESTPEPISKLKPEAEPEPESEPEPAFDHGHVDHHHKHEVGHIEHDHSHSDHDHADHEHEHSSHHLEHPDHDHSIIHSMDENPAVQMLPEHPHEHMGDHMANKDQIDHDLLEDQTNHTDHMDDIHIAPHGGHHIADVSNLDNTEMHQPVVDLIMPKEHSEIPQFGDPAFAPSAPLFDDNAPAIEIVSGPTVESVISTERTDEPSLVDDIKPEINIEVIEDILPPLLNILNPEPQDDQKTPKEDLLVTDTPIEENVPVSPEGGALVEVLPPVLPPVGFPSEEPILSSSDPIAESPVTQNTDISEPELTGSCQPRSLEMCSDMPYASTMLPNWVNDQNSEDLFNVSLPYFRDIIMRSNCSPRARGFACAVLEPPCVMDPSGQDTILPPCRSFCRSVGTTCAEFIISGFSLSDVFECERFPDSTDPSVCFDMSEAPVDDIKVTPEPSLPSSSEPETGNIETQGFNSSDYPERQDYQDFAENDERIEVDFLSVVQENPSDFVSEASNTAESDVNVAQNVLDEVLESVSPLSLAGEVPSQPEVPQENPEGGPLICTLDMFLCWDGSDCLDNSALCDGFDHCIDASDEYNCTAPIEFSGFSQSAVPPSPEPFETATTIDFDLEPQDLFGFSTFTPLEDLPQAFEQTTEIGFDEPTTLSLFNVIPPSECELTCLDGTCITAEQLNNGVSDCPDGTDEKNMPN